MRTDLLPQPQHTPTQAEIARIAATSHFKSPLPPLPFLAAATALILAGSLLRGQAPATQTPQAPATERPTHTPKRPSPAHPAAEPSKPVPDSVTPPVPVTPNWPAFEHPAQASVVWDSHGLSIEAANSSLEQILKDVSAATGVKVEGMTTDQRVFGTYGPGLAGEVLSQLLQGSGYNVIMIGNQGQGAPRQILLSARQTGSSQASAKGNPTSNDEDNEVDEQPPIPEPEPRPGLQPGMVPRTPEQRRQEQEERQRLAPPMTPQPPPNPQN